MIPPRRGFVRLPSPRGYTDLRVLDGGTGLLALGVLWCLAGALETVLLALLNPGITGEKPGLAHGKTGLFPGQGESAGNAVGQGAGPAGGASARYLGHDRVPSEGLGNPEGLHDDALVGEPGQNLIQRPTVNDDLAGPLVELDLRRGGLTAARGVKVPSLIHRSIYSSVPVAVTVAVQDGRAITAGPPAPGGGVGAVVPRADAPDRRTRGASETCGAPGRCGVASRGRHAQSPGSGGSPEDGPPAPSSDHQGSPSDGNRPSAGASYRSGGPSRH